MESVKKGYKRTEADVIPEDWRDLFLENVTTKVGSGITPRGGSKVYQDYGRPLVRSQNVGWGTLLLDDIAYISDEIHATFDATEIIEHDVFLNITGASIGRSAVADERVAQGNVNQHVCIIRANFDLLVAQYLNYFLLSDMGQKQIESFQAGGNRQGLNFGQIRSIKIVVPPTLKEQQAIADALSEVDEQITALDALIVKKRDIKHGAMQDLLTGRERLSGFSGEWVTKTIGSALSIKHGKNQKDIVDTNGQYPILATGGVIGRTNIPLYAKPSVLIGRKGTIDVPQFMDTPFWTVDTLFYSEIHNGYDAKFLFYRFWLIDWYTYNAASGVPSLNARTIENIEIRTPPTLEEQQAIVTILSDMDEEISILEAQREKTVALKQGMMQELLTGKTRLI